jgi:hypothetical protein
MKSIIILAGAAAAAVASPCLAGPGPQLRLKDVVAEVRIIPENRADFQVNVTRTYPGLPQIRVSQQGGGLVVDGGLYRRIKGCGAFGTIAIKDGPRVPKNQVPQIVIRAPLAFSVDANGYVKGNVGATRALGMDVSGCGDWNIGDVAGKLDLDVSGLGDVRVGNTGSAEVELSGLGDVDIASVNNGPLSVSASGMGDVRVRGGHATTMKASLSGMGDLSFRGVADSLNADASGMGEINVAKVTGPVRKSRSGLASINVGN